MKNQKSRLLKVVKASNFFVQTLHQSINQPIQPTRSINQPSPTELWKEPSPRSPSWGRAGGDPARCLDPLSTHNPQVAFQFLS